MIDENLCHRPTIDIGRFPNHRDLPLMEKLIEALRGLQPTDIGTLDGIEPLNANVLYTIGEGVAIDEVDAGRIQHLLARCLKCAGVAARQASAYRPLRI